jgi:hypothetical protein
MAVASTLRINIGTILNQELGDIQVTLDEAACSALP